MMLQHGSMHSHMSPVAPARFKTLQTGSCPFQSNSNTAIQTRQGQLVTAEQSAGANNNMLTTQGPCMQTGRVNTCAASRRHLCRNAFVPCFEITHHAADAQQMCSRCCMADMPGVCASVLHHSRDVPTRTVQPKLSSSSISAGRCLLAVNSYVTQMLANTC